MDISKGLLEFLVARDYGVFFYWYLDGLGRFKWGVY